MADLTMGINPHQDVAGMVADYEKKQAALDAEAEATKPIPRSEMDVDREGERLVAKGRLNPQTGAEIPMTAKARTLSRWVPSQRYIQNFDQIRWNK